MFGSQQTPTRLDKATPAMAIRNMIQVAHQDPLALPPFTDIATEKQFHDLIMNSFEAGHPPMSYFGLTPVHEIPKG